MLGRLTRHEMLWLDRSLGFPDGFYRAKEFSDSGAIVLPEDAIPDELANKLRLRKPEETPATTSREIKLGKRDLVAYFESLRREDDDEPSSHGSSGAG